MNPIQKQIEGLPTVMVGSQPYLSYQAVTDTVAAFLFPKGVPTQPTSQIDEAGYRRILQTADSLCRGLGYQRVVKLTPPDVAFADTGLYWCAEPAPATSPAAESEAAFIHIGPGPAEMMADGLLLDARLSQLGLDEVTRQHFKIPVTASDGVIALMHRAVASDWPNDYRGIWHDLLGMCISGGKDISPTERLFTVIIRGLGTRRYWQFKARLEQAHSGAPFLSINLADEPAAEGLFELGQVVMTPGAAALNVDFSPYLAQHRQGQWGQLDSFDSRQNDRAVKEGLRILSAYDVPIGDGETARLWIITEADRRTTTLLTPSEY